MLRTNRPWQAVYIRNCYIYNCQHICILYIYSTVDEFEWPWSATRKVWHKVQESCIFIYNYMKGKSCILYIYVLYVWQVTCCHLPSCQLCSMVRDMSLCNEAVLCGPISICSFPKALDLLFPKQSHVLHGQYMTKAQEYMNRAHIYCTYICVVLLWCSLSLYNYYNYIIILFCTCTCRWYNVFII